MRWEKGIFFFFFYSVYGASDFQYASTKSKKSLHGLPFVSTRPSVQEEGDDGFALVLNAKKPLNTNPPPLVVSVSETFNADLMDALLEDVKSPTIALAKEGLADLITAADGIKHAQSSEEPVVVLASGGLEELQEELYTDRLRPPPRLVWKKVILSQQVVATEIFTSKNRLKGFDQDLRILGCKQYEILKDIIEKSEIDTGFEKNMLLFIGANDFLDQVQKCDLRDELMKKIRLVQREKNKKLLQGTVFFKLMNDYVSKFNDISINCEILKRSKDLDCQSKRAIVVSEKYRDLKETLNRDIFQIFQRNFVGVKDAALRPEEQKQKNLCLQMAELLRLVVADPEWQAGHSLKSLERIIKKEESEEGEKV